VGDEVSVTISNVITVDYPSEKLMKWCQQNLKLKNPEYSKKQRMHFWIGNTPEWLYLYEVRGDKLILPFGTLRQLVPLIPEEVGRGNNVFIRDFPVAEKVDYHCEVPLYDYQQKAVEEVYWKQYGILQSAAGSGKTQMGIALIAKLGKKALWLTHTKDLLTQSKQRAEQYMNPALLGTITEGKVSIGSGITFATVQTMCNLDLAQYKNYWDVIIVDECHRVAGTPTAVSQFSKVLNSLAARHKYGLSATVHRSDGLIQSTYALLGEVVYTVPTEAVADKIMKVGIYPVPTGVGISRECLNTDGTLNYAKLIGYLAESEERNRMIVECITADRDKPALILSDRLGHLETLMSMLPADMREDAVMVSGKMTTKKGKAEREQAIADMRTGEKRYLFATYSLAREGLDIPCLERLYLTTPIKDKAWVIQSIGRIARVFHDKSKPVAYDFVDDIAYLHKMYKKRCTIYRSINCYWAGDDDE
jgi:superfamily II DNA or RNA helicase